MRHVRVAIVGTGFAGLGLAIRLRQRGVDDFLLLERATAVGGTWRDNTYPGCACDVPSHLYSFSFAPNPDWSRVFSSQPEIRVYLQDCAERFGVLPHVRFGCELLEAAWCEAEGLWHMQTTGGPLTADLLVLGHGPLSEPAWPSLPGLDRFEGRLFHSAQWDHGYELAGKRVAVIGTGASAIQFVPRIQPLVDRLYLFQRTPPWVLPRQDRPTPAWLKLLFHAAPRAQRFLREQIYWRMEQTAVGLVYQPARLAIGDQAAREHLARQVPDPALRAKLTPNYAFGCKRILLSDDYYPAVAQPNVELITDRIRDVQPHAIVTESGEAREVDAIICGTGFHVTDAELPRRVRGRGGTTLAETWRAGPTAYLGLTVASFPNCFLLIGPHTGLGHNSMIYMIESQIAYVLDALRAMARWRLRTVEVRPEAQAAFQAEMHARMQGTVWTSGCRSWYLDAAGESTVLWPGFTFEYRRRTRRFDAARYHVTSRPPAAVPVRAAAG